MFVILRTQGSVHQFSPFNILISTGCLIHHKREKGYSNFFFRQIKERRDRSVGQTPWPRNGEDPRHTEKADQALSQGVTTRGGTLCSHEGHLLAPGHGRRESKGYSIHQFLR